MSVEAGQAGSPGLRPRNRRAKASAKSRPRARFSLVGLIGELFMTAGVLVLLFLGWQLWLNDIIVGSEQSRAAAELSQGWALPDSENTETPAAPAETPDPQETAGTVVEPVVLANEPANAEKFAVLMVPRWGEGWERPIAEGIGVSDVLNTGSLGHYPDTALPGEVGNFAIASHRMAYGGGFKNLHELQVGDHVYIETQDGWYSYVYRSSEYVLPTGVGVIDEVPQMPDATPVDRIITLTTCNPFFSTAERLVAYGVLDAWYPRAGGPPAEIAATVSARSN